MSDDDNVSEALATQQSIRIFNDLYGNDICSYHELAKGYTIPTEPGRSPEKVPEDIAKARDNIMAKHKLNLILRSKSTTDLHLKVSDLVQVFIKLQNEKRGKWSYPKPILGYDHASRIVTVPGQSGRKIKAAVEDVRFAIIDDELGIKSKRPLTL